MKKADLFAEILDYKNQIGRFDLCFGKSTKADFVMGYYFDEIDGEYKVYKNGERGMSTVRYSGKDEGEALNALLHMVKGYATMLSNIKQR